MNTKDLVESLNEIAVNDLSEGANIVDHPAHMAAIELIGLDVMRADVRRLTDELAAIKRGRNAYFNNRGEDWLRDKIGVLINELRRKTFEMGKIKDEVSRLKSTVVNLQKELKASWPPVQDKGDDV